MSRTDANVRRLPPETLALHKRLRDVGRHHERDLERIRAFMSASRIALQQARRRFAGQPIDDGLERDYAAIAERWGKDGMSGFHECFALLTLALEARREDVLGPLFMALELGDSYRGQFFTPPAISRTMAEINIAGIEEVIAKNGFATMSEPACGSGGMTIEFAEAMIRRGFNPVRHLRAHLIDKDRICADMAYVQLTLMAIPAVVVHGDALRAEEWWTGETLFWPRPLGTPLSQTNPLAALPDHVPVTRKPKPASKTSRKQAPKRPGKRPGKHTGKSKRAPLKKAAE